VNGISGIGTGFSCNIPAYNPTEIVAYLRNKLQQNQLQQKNELQGTPAFVPHYKGFAGTIVPNGENKYLVRGRYEKLAADKIRITELPVGTWTMPYITCLEELMDGGVDKNGKKIPSLIKDFTSVCTEISIDIIVEFPRGKLADYEGTVDANGVNGVEKVLKLATSISSTNMNMFDDKIRLRKYADVAEIIDTFYRVRYDAYERRKAYQVNAMQQVLRKLSNRARYILANLDGSIDLRKKNSAQVLALLQGMQFDTFDEDYKYLTKMPMDSVTNENVEVMLREKAHTEHELETLIRTSIEQIWSRELDEFEVEYNKFVAVSTTKAPRNATTQQAKKVVRKVAK
jgi:DNA topoisomerase-2